MSCFMTVSDFQFLFGNVPGLVALVVATWIVCVAADVIGDVKHLMSQHNKICDAIEALQQAEAGRKRKKKGGIARRKASRCRSLSRL